MTEAPQSAPAPSNVPPLQLKVAAALCAVVGVLSVFGAIAVSLPLLQKTWVPLVINLAAALSVCVAAILVWKRRKLGAYLLVLGWALPTANNVIAGAGVHSPSLLMVLALLTLALSWHLLD
jgi:hypothetical protein